MLIMLFTVAFHWTIIRHSNFRLKSSNSEKFDGVPMFFQAIAKVIYGIRL